MALPSTAQPSSDSRRLVTSSGFSSGMSLDVTPQKAQKAPQGHRRRRKHPGPQKAQKAQKSKAPMARGIEIPQGRIGATIEDQVADELNRQRREHHPVPIMRR